jgi:uroporphyrinogen decarboxylase
MCVGRRAALACLSSARLTSPLFSRRSLVIPQALGLTVEMKPGPFLPAPIREPADMARLAKDVDTDATLGYVYEALTKTRHGLKGEVPLIGFCGAPWTLMAYMVEGGGTKTWQESKTWLHKYPDASHELLDRTAVVCADFLVGQVKAGAQVRLSGLDSAVLG